MCTDMQRKILITAVVALMLLASVLLMSCEKEQGEYISGSYMNDSLNVGYNFFPNGTGFQFINENAYMIEYVIKDGNITITTLVEPKVIETFSFEQYSESVIIGGVIYIVVPDEVSVGPIPYV